MRVLTTQGRAVRPKVGDHQVQPVTMFAIQVAVSIIEGYRDSAGRQYEAWVTSLLEGVHKTGSLHPTGFAVDIDVVAPWPTPDSVWNALLAQLKENLTNCGYDVMFSKKSDGSISHFHIEWDPK